ncbi:hypothetical protein ASE75_01845 [Sphingomonas sp. Leaf17]|uniref:sialidase family protein n=1 Tax=Sphingomonas sp. Leaf17 TaxID=1735683 RepID=UPI0006F2CD4A|nr:sialidase family protein [Sphingomonas sp. Leaf17]KQM67693.1 hypothetical protein ASE75_01845 [Sphingomonas sp. Leaf17]
MPTTSDQNHAAFLLPLSNGDILCAWFGGSKEGRPDVAILMSQLAAGTTCWTAPVMVSEDATRSEQNPVLFEAPDGAVWLIHTAQVLAMQDTSEVRVRRSRDHGASWSDTMRLESPPGTFVRQPVVLLDTGEWLLPTFHCGPIPGEAFRGNNDSSAVRISADQGASWREYPVADSLGAVHMAVVDQGGGTLIAFFRSRYADAIRRSVSHDHGRTWTAPATTTLPNNNASIGCTGLADGRIAMVFNDARSETGPVDTVTLPDGRIAPRAVWGVKRSPLVVAISADGGRTWPVRRTLRADPPERTEGEPKRNRELSYPSIVQQRDGLIVVAFTRFRAAIDIARFPVSWVEAG